MISFAAVQKAAVARWKGYGPLTAIIGGRVLDGIAPKGTMHPYLRIGQKTEMPALLHLGGNGWANTLNGHIFSRVLEDSEIAAIAEQMNAAVVEPLTLEGYGTAVLKPDLLVTLEEEDGLLRHGNLRYRITTYPTG